jgi:hypothetical protein
LQIFDPHNQSFAQLNYFSMFIHQLSGSGITKKPGSGSRSGFNAYGSETLAFAVRILYTKHEKYEVYTIQFTDMHGIYQRLTIIKNPNKLGENQ